MKKGDFIVVNSPNFVVHARNQPWNTGVVTTNVAVKVGASKVEVISPWYYLFNGKLTLLKPKKSFENADIFIKRINDRTTVIRNKQNDFIRIYFYLSKRKNLPQTQFLNTIVRLNDIQHNVNGLCLGHVEKAAGIFTSIYDPKTQDLVKKEYSDNQRKFARHICRQRLVPRVSLGVCVEAYLHTESIDFVTSIADLAKHLSEARQAIKKRKLKILRRKKN